MCILKLKKNKFPPVYNTFNKEDVSYQRSKIDQIGKDMDVKNMEGWYSVTTETIRKHGGGAILQYHNNSVSKLLSTVYPEYLIFHSVFIS